MTNEPNQPDRRLQRPRYTWWQLVSTLLEQLPPPLNPTPEALFARNQTAFAEVAAMAPVNDDEAKIAAQCVIARARGDEAAREALARTGDFHNVRLANAQFALMERTAIALRGQLLKLQAARFKREQNHAAADGDAWMQHIAFEEMQQAVAQGLPPVDPAIPLSPAAPADQLPGEPPVLATIAPPAPQQEAPLAASPALLPRVAAWPPVAPPATRPAEPPEPQPARTQRRARTGDDPDEPVRDIDAEVEYWAAVYPQRVREIRAHGGVPPDCRYGPPDRALARAIVRSTSAAVRALDLAAAAE